MCVVVCVSKRGISIFLFGFEQNSDKEFISTNRQMCSNRNKYDNRLPQLAASEQLCTKSHTSIKYIGNFWMFKNGIFVVLIHDLIAPTRRKFFLLFQSSF